MTISTNGSSPGGAVRRPSRAVLSDETYDALRIMLLDHTIPPGQRINIDSIARELDVSQTPVREALARLEADDLVVKQPLRGYSATELLTADQIDDLFQFRALIEPWMAGRAAEERSAADSEELVAEIERGRQSLELDLAHTYGELSRHDERFHFLVARIARSDFAHDAYAHAHCQLHVYRVTQAALARLRESGDAEVVDSSFGPANVKDRGILTMREHAAIADAIVAGQKNAAAAHMLDHVESSRKRIPPLSA
jgi:DNA-binding GntR family transcriptional regulator